MKGNNDKSSYYAKETNYEYYNAPMNNYDTVPNMNNQQQPPQLLNEYNGDDDLFYPTENDYYDDYYYVRQQVKEVPQPMYEGIPQPMNYNDPPQPQQISGKGVKKIKITLRG